MKAKATSFDIAYRAGVSQSTVSRALRNSPLVSDSTKEKIKAIAKELNYKVDKNASNLRSQKTGTLALLLFEDPTLDDSMINPFFLSMLGNITRSCATRGYDLLVSFQQLSNDWHADYEDASKADGIILLGYGDYVDYEHRLIQLLEQGTHFVRWGAVLEGHPGVSIGCDNAQGGYILTQHLLDLGRKHFAFVGGASTHSPEFYERYLGHEKALQRAGIVLHPECQVDAINTEESGFMATKALLDAGHKIDAILGASDLIALGAMRAVRESGLRVPQDVSVVGFDDIPMASFSTPRLTTIQQNTKLAAERLVDNLIGLIEDKPAQSEAIAAKLIIRESCGDHG